MCLLLQFRASESEYLQLKSFFYELDAEEAAWMTVCSFLCSHYLALSH